MDKKINKNKKVFVGMSGGVDSSVSAFLLKQQGYDVTGVFINGYNLDGCSAKDAEDARKTAEHIEIPFYVLDAREEYYDNVVEYMINGYKSGITPNPDVMCNKKIKFGFFLEKAIALGADFVATGHYAVIKKEKNGENGIYESRDKNKDQSYFLWTLTQKELCRSLFPVGGYLKSEVREIARKAKIPVAEKKDSQGICFLGKISLPDFLKEQIKSETGDILDTKGKIIGKHSGAVFYTIGQRHIGAQIKSEINGKEMSPYFVISKNIKDNTITVAHENDEEVYTKEISLAEVNINCDMKNDIFENGLDIFCRTRYRGKLVEAKIFREKKSWRLIFQKPQKFIAIGQSAVFYDIIEDRDGCRQMIGGGTIGQCKM